MNRSFISPVLAIFHREFDRFIKQKARCVSAVVRPLLWLVVFAAGFRSVLGIAIQAPYETYITYDLYVTPGLIGMIALFNVMQSSLSMVYDRETGSMKLLMTAPISRRLLLIYKLLATATISTLQAYIFIGISILYGVDLPWIGLLTSLPTVFIASYFIALVGLILASQVKELENFAGIMNFVIFPAFFLSSALYPLWQIRDTSEVVYQLAVFNPFTYVVESIRFGIHDTPITVATIGLLIASAAFSIVVHKLFTFGQTR
jgi:ABC-2 type transport system permease protein